MIQCSISNVQSPSISLQYLKISGKEPRMDANRRELGLKTSKIFSASIICFLKG